MDDTAPGELITEDGAFAPDTPISRKFDVPIPDPEVVPLLKVPDVARWLGIGRSACYEAIKRGELPSVRLGRRTFVPTAAIRALVGLEQR